MRDYCHSRHIAVEQVSNFETVGADTWAGLLAVADDVSVFQTFGWLTSWWSEFAAGRELLLLKASAGSQIVGLAPLFKEKKSARVVRMSSVRFIGEEHADYLSFIVDASFPEVHQVLLMHLMRLGGAQIECNFDQVPETSTFAGALRNLKGRNDVVLIERERTICPYVKVRGNQQVVDKLIRKDSLRRSVAKLKKLGDLSVEHVREKERIRENLDGFFYQHVTRWSVTQFPSLFQRVGNRRFYEKLIESNDNELQLVFTILRLDNLAIAYHFGFLSAGDLIWYKPSFDLGFHRLSPGEVLLKELLILATALDCGRLDFTRGNEAFKSRFATGIRENVSFTLSSRPSYPVAAARVLREKLTSRIRATLAWSSSQFGAPSNQFCETIKRIAEPANISIARKGKAVAGLVFRSIWDWTYSRTQVHLFECAPNGPIGECGTVVELELENILDSSIFRSLEERQELLQVAFPRLKDGDRCYAVFKEQKIVAYGWATTKSPMPITEVHTSLTLEENDVCLYDFFVYPGHRRKGIYGTLLTELRAKLSSSRIYIYALSSNLGSIRGIYKSGFSYLYTIDRRICLGRESVFQVKSKVADVGR